MGWRILLKKRWNMVSSQHGAHKTRYMLALATVVVFGALGTMMAVHASTEPVSAPISADEQTQALRVALQYANVESKDGHGISARTWPASVASAQAVATTRQLAASMVGTSDEAQTRAIVIAIEGNFTLFAPTPNGADAPSGHHLVVVFDPANGSMTDFGLSPETIDLTQLGDPVTLH